VRKISLLYDSAPSHALTQFGEPIARMRMENNHAQGIFQQLRLAVQRGLTCKPFALYYRIEALNTSSLRRMLGAQLCIVLQLIHVSPITFER